MGFSYQALSSVQAVPVFEAFVNAGYYKNIFSICLGPNSGTLTLVITPHHYRTLFIIIVKCVREALIRTCTLAQ